MSNRYLDGLRTRAGGNWSPGLYVIWVLLVVMFLAIWQLLAPSGGGAPPIDRTHDALIFVAWLGLAVFVAAGLAMIVQSRRVRAQTRLVNEAERRLLYGDAEGAVQAARASLAQVPSRSAYGLYMVLGRAAEWHGDVREAAEIYARAANGLRGWSAGYYGPIALARRAFTLAAAGDLEGAQACVARLLPNAHVTARASALRAQALVLAKRGAHREVLDLLDRERRVVRGLMVARDRALMRAIAAAAKRALEPASREASPEPAPPAPTAEWIARVFPPARGLWGMP